MERPSVENAVRTPSAPAGRHGEQHVARACPRSTPPQDRAADGAQPRWPALLDGVPWIALRVGSDALMLAGACAAASVLVPTAVWPLALFPVVTLLAFESGGRYRQRMRDAILDSAARGFTAISMGAMSVLALMLALGADPATSGPLIAWTWLVSLVAVTATATTLIALKRTQRRRARLLRPAIIVGADAAGVEIEARLRRMPEYGLRAVGFLDARRRALPAGAPPLLGGLDDLAAVAARHGVRHVIVGFPEASHHDTLELVARCDALGLRTTVMPRLSAAVNAQTCFEYLGVQPLLNLRAVDRDGWGFAVKHAFDRVLAGILLALLAPLMALLAACVALSSPGPVLFRQRRSGRDGRVFELLKFRTMVVAEEAAVYALYPDLAPRGMAPGGVEGVDRRTRVGRLLRRTSLDELPQLVNVLRGEMSLVGPRPERPELAELFRQEVLRYGDRQRVRAGITGWAQVQGSRGQTPLAERVELDNFYIEHWSLALDAKILLLTLPALLRGS